MNESLTYDQKKGEKVDPWNCGQGTLPYLVLGCYKELCATTECIAFPCHTPMRLEQSTCQHSLAFSKHDSYWGHLPLTHICHPFSRK